MAMTMTIPVNDSITTPGNRIYTEYHAFTPSTRGPILYLNAQRVPSGVVHYNNIRFYWSEDSIPANTIVTKRTVHFYSRYSYPFLVNGSSLNAGWNSRVLSESGDLISQGTVTPDIMGDYAQIDSHTGTNRPYVEIEYEFLPPGAPTNLYPSETTVSTRDIIRFSWAHTSNDTSQQTGFTLQYSINSGSTWTTINQTTNNQYHDMPANTLPTTGEVYWRVKTRDQNNKESAYSASVKFTLALVPQKAPDLIYPISGYLEGSEDIRFRWSFIGGTAEDKQSKYDFEYSTNGGSSWNKTTKSTSDQYHDLAGGVFVSGNIHWRVKTYNTFNESSPYSEVASFYIVNKPPMPQIVNVSNSGKPTITWNSMEQQIYEIEILENNKVVYSTGHVASIMKSHKVSDYLLDGDYVVKLRVVNDFNMASPWSAYNFTISTTKPPKPIVEIYNGEYSVTIKIENQEAKNLIYRDNILIGIAKDNIFVDFTGENNNEYKYFVRAVDETDNFNDSDIKIAKCKFNGNTLALAEMPEDFLKLKYGLDSIPRKTNNFNLSGTLQYYDGREYPVVEYSEFKSKAKTVSFALKDKIELNKLINLIDERKTLLFRDVDGENIYGTILGIDYEKNILGYYDIGFTITKTEYEGVSYD